MNVVLTSESSTNSTWASGVGSPSGVSAVAAHARVGTVHQHVGSETLLVQFLFVDIVPLGLEEVGVSNELFLVQVLLLFLVKGLGEFVRDLAKRRAEVHFSASLVREVVFDTRL